MKENQMKKPARIAWKGVVIGGIPGLIVGSAGEEILRAASQGEEPEPGCQGPGAGSGASDPGPHFEGEVQVAHDVHDDLTFSEAFAAARDEVGPGGAFVWHGQVFSTFRADDPEWLAMSSEERLEHSDWILSQVHGTPYTTDDPVHPQIPEDYTIEEVYTLFDETGDISDIGVGEADGHFAVFVDENMDGGVDRILIDVNDNETFEENETVNTEGAGIELEDPYECVYGPPPFDDDQLYGEPDDLGL